MPRKWVTIDEFRLTLLVPPDLPARAATGVRMALADAGFRAALRRAVRAEVAADRRLARARIALSQ